MENLEKQLIKRLNNILINHNLKIISGDFNYKMSFNINKEFKEWLKQYNYILVEIENNTIIEGYFTWDNIENLLLSNNNNYSIFNVINKYTFLNSNIKYIEIERKRILLSSLYNELNFLTGCSSYEELTIKMDLIGI